MNFFLLPLLALVQASCYDYEYYDEVTKQPIPGNACANQAAAASKVVPAAPSFGQPQTLPFAPSTPASFGQPQTLPTPYTPTFSQSAPAPAFSSSATVFTSGAPVYTSGAPMFTTSAPAFSQSTPIAVSTSPIYGRPVGSSIVPAQVAVSTQVRSAAAVSPLGISAELQYYKDLGERQARQHKRNSRIVKEASQDLSKTSLVNRLVAGAGNAAPWYPPLRLSAQKKAAEAYKSEKRIANKNAEDAYQRFQRDPSQLNLLVSKYQDLNADLRDAAYHYNVVNSGTFGQRISSGSIFGGLSGGLLGGVTQIITQKKQSEDLEDIQRQMKRVARQIQAAAQSAVQQKAVQGSVQQRMMAMSVYGPQPR